MNKLNEALEYFEQSLIILKKNFDSEHIDVKNIQNEIFDLKEIIKSLSSSPNEDYNNRRNSYVHKELFITSQINQTKTKSSISSSKSLICIIL